MKYIKHFDTLSAQTEYLEGAELDTYLGYVDGEGVQYDDVLAEECVPDYEDGQLAISDWAYSVDRGGADAANLETTFCTNDDVASFFEGFDYFALQILYDYSQLFSIDGYEVEIITEDGGGDAGEINVGMTISNENGSITVKNEYDDETGDTVIVIDDLSGDLSGTWYWVMQYYYPL